MVLDIPCLPVFVQTTRQHQVVGSVDVVHERINFLSPLLTFTASISRRDALLMSLTGRSWSWSEDDQTLLRDLEHECCRGGG